VAHPALHLCPHGVQHLRSRGHARARLTRRALLRAGGRAALAATAAAVLLPLAAELAPAAAALPFQEIADGIFLRQGLQEEVGAGNCGAIANIGFIVGAASVAVIDTGSTRQEGLALRAAVEAATSRPVSHVIATHVHFDHCFGHSAFSDLPVRFVGHRSLPRALAERVDFYSKLLTDLCPQDFAGTVVVPPNQTVEDVMEIDLGDRPLRLQAWPTAHTNTDLTVLDRRTGTLWAGDLLFDRRLPTLDGSLLGWLSVLDRLLTEEVARVVPGHGAVSDGRVAVAAERRYLERLRDDVRTALAEDLGMQATLDRLADQELDGWLVVENVHGRNVVNAYTELEWE